MNTLTETTYRPFGKTGFQVSPLGFGGAPIGVLKTDANTVGTVLKQLLDCGLNLIDTAACYYGSEEAIGQAVNDRRDEFVLVTKCGHAEAGGSTDDDFTPAVIRRNIDQSLNRLKTDRLDVVLLHSCKKPVLEQGDAIAAAIEARDAGKVRFIGYSGDNESAEYAATLADIAVIQTSISICDQVNIDGVLPLARKNNIGIMAKRPVANGAWKTEDQQYERYLNYARPYHERFATMNLALGDFPGVQSWSELALRFTLSHDGVSTAIVGTTNPNHIDSNLDAAAKGPLPLEQVTRIRTAFRDGNTNGDWIGLT